MIYRIANWDGSFETYETKKLTHLKWVPVPNKHDGLGFRRVASQKNRCELFAAWNLILQVASKGRKDVERGKLIRDGKPLTSEDLAMMTGFPASIFATALSFFASKEMGWLVVDNQGVVEPPVKTAEGRMETAEPPAEGKGIEGKGIEGNEGKGIEVGANASPQQQSDEEFVKELIQDLAYQGIDVQREYLKMLKWCSVHRKQPTRKRFISWLNRIEKPMGGGFVTFPSHREEKKAKEYHENLTPKML